MNRNTRQVLKCVFRELNVDGVGIFSPHIRNKDSARLDHHLSEKRSTR